MESHKGAETIPRQGLAMALREYLFRAITILCQNAEAALDEKGRVKNNQAKAHRHNIIAGALLQKLADFFLHWLCVSACSKAALAIHFQTNSLSACPSNSTYKSLPLIEINLSQLRLWGGHWSRVASRSTQVR